MKNKILACVLLMIMAFTLMWMPVQASSADIVAWDGYSYEQFSGGDGTAANPYQISNANQFYYLVLKASETAYNNANYILMADIDLNNKIFPSIASFSGKLDGNGKTIYNLYINNTDDVDVGLIKNGTSCTISNLTLSGSVNNSGTKATGAFVGSITGGSIKNCVNLCSVTAASSSGGVGGFVGCLNGTTQIIDCVNKANVNGNSYVGGMCGLLFGPKSYDTLGEYVSVSKCYNIADISGVSNVGGLVGSQTGTTIQKSFNVGKVSGNTIVGGIVGNGYSENCTTWYTSNHYGTRYSDHYASSFINNCYNIGDISATTSYAGGIAGKYYRCTSANYGDKAGHSSSSAAGSMSCTYNVGKITGASSVGGIVGYANYLPIENCYYLEGVCENSTSEGKSYSADIMATAGGYTNFDFLETWGFRTAGEYQYPLLRCFEYPTITFLNADGTKISQEKHHYGDVVTPPTVPTKDADDAYEYAFKGWDKEIIACDGDATYTATYELKAKEYTVIFKDEDGTVLSTAIYHYGDKVIAPEAPTKAADSTGQYIFNGWDNEVVDCVGETTYTATYALIKVDDGSSDNPKETEKADGGISDKDEEQNATVSGGDDSSDDNGKDSLSVGAIVAIIAAVALAIGLLGFSLFWFLIEKKNFSDLLDSLKNIKK